MAGSQMEGGSQPNSDPPQDDRLVLKWLESQSDQVQKDKTAEKLKYLLEKASQPRHASGNACIKLCFFIEQCRNSQSSSIRGVVYSEKTCQDLFNFFIDWNEKNQNRSMRQVLELAASLISKNENKELVPKLQSLVLKRTLSIITHQGAQPLVKPSFKALECLLGKHTISSEILLSAYKNQNPGSKAAVAGWNEFFLAMFDWMELPDISPAAGKFLVTLFRELKGRSPHPESQEKVTSSWQRWIRAGLSKYPQALENVKNYLLQPLFRLDRSGSLEFLEDLNKQSTIWDMENDETDFQSLLQLAAIETGKKAGLIEEPNPLNSQKLSKKPMASIILEEEKIGDLLSHPADTVRSLAFSVLVSSSSSVRPFSPVAMKLLRSNIGILYSDTDAKFRNETLSSSKHMIERLRGATALLVRETRTLSFQPPAQSGKQLISARPKNAEALLKHTQNLLEKHQSFLEWYVDFLLAELVPTASYQRHITALKAIEMLLRSGLLKRDLDGAQGCLSATSTTWPYSLEFFVPGTMRIMMGLLMDPFEDVRNEAATILELAMPQDFSIPNSVGSELYQVSKLILEKVHNNLNEVETGKLDIQNPTPISDEKRNGPPLQLLRDFLEQANEALARTGRADYADGVARCYKLLYVLTKSPDAKKQLLNQLVDDLESKIAIARRDLGEAVLNAPIHGTFAALSSVWCVVDLSSDFQACFEAESQAYWDNFQLRIANSSSKIWTVVKEVLCNDSPEGHLPEEIDEGDEVDTKDILSYSFRAIHESSNLLRVLIDQTNPKWSISGRLPTNIFAQIGDLAFAQLSNLRHRGAFSTVSLTFARCCQLAQYHDPLSDSGPNLLQQWYQGSLNCIFTQASTTRRSAGIPSLMTGIMAANSRSPTFGEVTKELLRIASLPVSTTDDDETKLPQVHALNSLKEAIKGAITGKLAESHLADCMKVAASSLNHPVWAIRNCGLLLFRSIIDYLLGTNTRKAAIETGWDGKSLKISYESYPALPGLLIEILQTDTGSSAHEGIEDNSGAIESVFPVLDLIRRAGPPQAASEEIKTLVLRHLGSRVWAIREIAAQTVCTLIPKDKWSSEVQTLLGNAPVVDASDLNYRHGNLCAIKYVLERGLKEAPAMMIDGIAALGPILSEQKQQDYESSTFTRTAHINVLNTIALILRSPDVMEATSLAETAGKLTESLFAHNPLNQLESSIASSASSEILKSALCQRSSVQLAVLTIALRNNLEELGKVLNFATQHSSDLAVSALKCVEISWTVCKSTSTKDLEGILPCLIAACLMAIKSRRYNVQLRFYRNISIVLDRLCQQDPEISLSVLHLVAPLLPSPTEPGEPAALQAERLRLTTWGVLKDFQFGRDDPADDDNHRDIEATLKNWAFLLSINSDPSREKHEREVVVESLRSFYINAFFRNGIPNEEFLIPSLLVLYDIMNDDAVEIRNHGASIVSNLFSKPLVPLKAQKHLVKWLITNFGQSAVLRWNILCRATGTSEIQCPGQSSTSKLMLGQMVKLTPASEHFLKATVKKNELFAVESQNLWEDPVREVIVWSQAWKELPALDLSQGSVCPLSDAVLLCATWVNAALVTLRDHIQALPESKRLPTAAEFAAYWRVLTMAHSFIACHQDNYEDGNDDPYFTGWYMLSIREAVKNLGTFRLEVCSIGMPPFIWDKFLETRMLAEERLPHFF